MRRFLRKYYQVGATAVPYRKTRHACCPPYPGTPVSFACPDTGRTVVISTYRVPGIEYRNRARTYRVFFLSFRSASVTTAATLLIRPYEPLWSDGASRQEGAVKMRILARRKQQLAGCGAIVFLLPERLRTLCD